MHIWAIKLAGSLDRDRASLKGTSWVARIEHEFYMSRRSAVFWQTVLPAALCRKFENDHQIGGQFLVF